MVMVVLTSMLGLWTEACASSGLGPGAPADEPGVQDGSQNASPGAAADQPGVQDWYIESLFKLSSCHAVQH
jgi:hypothetical protein